MPGVWALVEQGLDSGADGSEPSPVATPVTQSPVDVQGTGADAEAGQGPVEPVMPELSGGESSLLGADTLLWLNQNLPLAKPAKVWSSLYISTRDGRSFISFVHRIRRISHTLVVVKDTSGAVFAMYNGEQWLDPADLKDLMDRKGRIAAHNNVPVHRGPKPDANFYGQGDCALVAIQPERRVFLPTKKDANYLYLQTSWPEAERNGIAMGGLPGFFGLHLHSSLDRGTCRLVKGHCPTFGSTCLASAEEFGIDVIEVWALSDGAVDARGDSSMDGVMSRGDTKTDQTMLELIGRKFYTERDY